MIEYDDPLHTVNYYYEIKEGTTVLGRPARYLALYDCHPDDMNSSMTKLHIQALENSDRVWIENTNSTYQIKQNDDFYYFSDRVDNKEFAWIKMQARDLEKL